MAALSDVLTTEILGFCCTAFKVNASIFLHIFNEAPPFHVPCDVIFLDGKKVMTGLTASLLRRQDQMHVGSIASSVWQWYSHAVFQRVGLTTSGRMLLYVTLGMDAISEQLVRPIRGHKRIGRAKDGLYYVPEDVGQIIIGDRNCFKRQVTAVFLDGADNHLITLEVTSHQPIPRHTSVMYRITGLDAIFDSAPDGTERYITDFEASLVDNILLVSIHTVQASEAAGITISREPPAGIAPIVNINRGHAIITTGGYLAQHWGQVPEQLDAAAEVLLHGQVVIRGLQASLRRVSQGRLQLKGVLSSIRHWYPAAELLGIQLAPGSGGTEPAVLQVLIQVAEHTMSTPAAGVIHGPSKVPMSAITNVYSLPPDLCRDRQQFQVQQSEPAEADVYDGNGALLIAAMPIKQYKPKMMSYGEYTYVVAGLSSIWDHCPDAFITGYDVDDSSGRLQVYIHRGPPPMPPAPAPAEPAALPTPPSSASSKRRKEQQETAAVTAAQHMRSKKKKKRKHKKHRKESSS